MAIGIVVSEASIAKFVSCQEHRRSPAAHQNRDRVFHQPHPQGVDLGVVGFPFCAAVPASVIVCPVGIVPAVCQVVFFVVAVQIVQGEPVVAGDKIDRRIVSPVLSRLQIHGTADPLGDSRSRPIISF